MSNDRIDRRATRIVVAKAIAFVVVGGAAVFTEIATAPGVIGDVPV